MKKWEINDYDIMRLPKPVHITDHMIISWLSCDAGISNILYYDVDYDSMPLLIFEKIIFSLKFNS